MDNEATRRKKLYSQYVKALEEGKVVTRFSEDDLIDIFDYAQDVFDETVQLEVLFSAAAVCPDSEEFALRKGYFYHENLSMDDSALRIAMAHPGEGASWSLLLSNLKNGACTPESMTDFLQNYSDFDDDTVLHLVDICAEHGLYEWLKENRDNIKNRCQYPSTFLYELAHEADEREEYDYCIELLEELTMIEPFNAHFWHMLAQIYIKKDDWDNALASIDYALAISSNSRELLYTKAQILYDSRMNVEEAYGIISDIIKNEEDLGDKEAAYHTLAAMYALDGKTDIAEDVIFHYLDANPANKNTVDIVLRLFPKETRIKALKLYFGKHAEWEFRSPDVDTWDIWVAGYYEAKAFECCAEILLTQLAYRGTLDNWGYLFTSLYQSGDYGELVATYSRYGDRGIMTLEDYFLVLLSMVREKMYDVALDFGQKLLTKIYESSPTFTERLEYKGVELLIKKIVAALKSGKAVDISTVDPFITEGH